jgi:hypothetical protein
MECIPIRENTLPSEKHLQAVKKENYISPISTAIRRFEAVFPTVPRG